MTTPASAELRKKYRTICADPPWSYREKFKVSAYGWHRSKQDKGPDAHYHTQPLDWIKALPVVSLAEPDSHLYLWTTNTFVVEAHDVARACGFEPRGLLTWVKPGFGTGVFFRGNTEHVVFGVRGKLALLRRDLPTGYSWPRGAHSRKPDAFYATVELASPGPYLELFARGPRLSWDVWGDESTNMAMLA